jgi:hypothetical protein
VVDDLNAETFGLPEAFVSAFKSAHDRDGRMKVVDQFFDREEIALAMDGAFEIRPNKPHEVYLVGSTSLIHIERPGPEGTLYVVQPVEQKRGTIEQRVLEDKIVNEMKKGRKLWLLMGKGSSASRRDVQRQEFSRESERLAAADVSCVSAPAIHPDEIVPDTSSPRLSAVGDGGESGALDLKAFGQLRTMLQNVRLQFWSGVARSQATESLSVAMRKAEEHDISGAIQSVEALENVFVRLIEQWENDFREAERKVKRGRGDVGDPAKFRALKDHHLDMKSRIAQTNTKFRIMLNWLREVETKMKHGEQGHSTR